MLSASCFVVQDKNAKFSDEHITEIFSGTSKIPVKRNMLIYLLFENYTYGVYVIKLCLYVYNVWNGEML